MSHHHINVRAEAIDIIRLIGYVEDDGCVACGYAFGYELEGCDECQPITALMKMAGMEVNDEDR